MRLFTVHGPKRTEPVPVEKKLAKHHSISLHLPDWLYLAIQMDATRLGQRSISGYCALLLAGIYEAKKGGEK